MHVRRNTELPPARGTALYSEQPAVSPVNPRHRAAPVLVPEEAHEPWKGKILEQIMRTTHLPRFPLAPRWNLCPLAKAQLLPAQPDS